MVSDGPTIVKECSAFMCNRKKPLNSVRLVVILDYFFVRFTCCVKRREGPFIISVLQSCTALMLIKTLDMHTETIQVNA